MRERRECSLCRVRFDHYPMWSLKSEFFLKRTVDTHRSARVVSGATREGSALGDTIADETERLAGHRCPRSSRDDKENGNGWRYTQNGLFVFRSTEYSVRIDIVQ